MVMIQGNVRQPLCQNHSSTCVYGPISSKEHVLSSRKYLDIAFSGFIGSLEKRGGDIRNKYGVGEFISGVHFALRSLRSPLRSRTLFTLF